MIMTFAVFSFLIDFKLVKYPHQIQLRYIRNIENFSIVNPPLTASLTIIFFSMAGIPPLAGFFAKIFVILTGLQSSFYSLIIFSVIISSISCFYYIRIIQLMYFTKSLKQSVSVPINKSNVLVLGISCIFLLFFFLDIELISIFVTRIVLSFNL